MMQILAIFGSLRPASTNTTLLKAAAALVPKGVTLNIYDGLDWLVASGELYEKPIALFIASPRANCAQASHMETLTEKKQFKLNGSVTGTVFLHFRRYKANGVHRMKNAKLRHLPAIEKPGEGEYPA